MTDEPPNDAADGIDISMLRTAVENTQPSGDAWFVSAGDDLILILMASAREAGVVLTRIDAQAAANVEKGKLVIVELPSAEGEGVITEVSKNGAVAVAVLDEPTIEWFTKAIRAGASDVLAGKPTEELIMSRLEKWKGKLVSH
ncbi:MAG: hypothetical protein ACKVS6_01200 [Planctomycetota bacterium]